MFTKKMRPLTRCFLSRAREQAVMRCLMTLILCAAVAFAQGQGGGRGRGGPRQPAPPFKRLAGGHPDMQGYWETDNFATAFDLETRDKAEYGIPAGKGVIVDPADGKIPYQPWALARKKELAEHEMYSDPQAHCDLSGVPRQMYTPFGFQILQPKNNVLLLYEAFHSYRIIPLDGRPHIPDQIRLFEGDSRGRWEGDTLVVDVTNQNPSTWFDMAGNFHSDALHVVERYTMLNLNTISYRATLEDTKVYTRPFTIAFNLVRNRDSNYEQLEFACVEGEQDLQHYTASEGKK